MSSSFEESSRSEPIPLVPFVTVLSFISLASVLGNCLVCLAMYQQPRLRTVMHYSMLSLGKSRAVTSIYIYNWSENCFILSQSDIRVDKSVKFLPPPQPNRQFPL